MSSNNSATNGSSFISYSTGTTQTIDSSTIYNYNGNGLLATQNIDTDGDGVVDQTINYNYGLRGDLYMTGGGGFSTFMATQPSATHGVSLTTYYDNGKVHQLSSGMEMGDYDGDGISDFYVQKQEYDQFGNITRESAELSFSSQGISPQYEHTYFNTYTDGNLTSKRIDYGSDGTIDSSYTYTYTANGKLASQTNYYYDTISNIVTYGYDANGRLTSESEDAGGDGTVEKLTNYTYDANGNRTSESIDYGNDGVDFFTSYTYDANGNKTSESIDYGNDGVDYTYAYTYDSHNNQTSKSFYDGDGVLGWTVTTAYQYDANGNITSQSTDENGDGIADQVMTGSYSYFLNTASYDNGANGTIDKVISYQYDFATGVLQTESIDTNNDGIADNSIAYAYDTNGNLITESVDTGNNGSINAVTSYSYDANNNLVSQTVDSNNDGTVDDSYHYTYNASGQLATATFNQGNDSTIELTTTYSYNADGKLVGESIDNNGDGVGETTVVYTYDANGNLAQTVNGISVENLMIIGGNGSDILNGGAGNDNISGGNGIDQLFGNGGKDVISGGNGDDVLVGGAGSDKLTGGNGADIFRYGSLSDSLLANFDRITDLKIGSDKIDGVNAVSASAFGELGTVNALNEAAIQAILTDVSFVANGAASFTFGSGSSQQTFVALNDSVAGFSAATDSIIDITGFSGNLANLAIV